MELQTPINEGQTGVEGQQEPIETAPELDEGNGTEGEPAAPATQQPSKPVQTPEQNAAYRERRIKAEREQDELIAEIYDGKYKTVAEYKAAKAEWDKHQAAEKLAEREAITTEAALRIMESERKAEEAKRIAEMTQAELKAYHAKEAINAEADNYAKHPKWGQFFTENREAIIAEAEKYAKHGGEAADMLDYATMIVHHNTWKEPEPVDIAAIKAEGVKEHLEALKKQNAPVEPRGGGIPNTPPATTGNALKDAQRNSEERLRRLKEM
jgi:hypothetical protein